MLVIEKRIWRLVLAMLSLCCLPAVTHAENWIRVGVSDDGTQSFLDTASVIKEGGMVRSWVKHVPKRTAFNSLIRKSYSYWIEGRVQDCAANSAAMTAAIYRDKKDRNVANYAYPQPEWKFFVAVPGSIGDSLNKSACAVAMRARDLKPRILKGSLSQGEWRSLGYDLANTYLVSIKIDSISRTAEDTVFVVVKSEFPRGAKLPDGRDYHTSVNLQIVNCKNKTFDTAETELFAIDGRIVDATYKSPAEIRPEQIMPGSFAAASLDMVCSAPITAADAVPENSKEAAQPSASEESTQLGFGTAWIASNGYVVTAFHVVDGAKQIVLLQSGEPIGTASIVATDPANDIAVLRPTFTGVPPAGLQTSSKPIPLGSRIFTLGFPQPPSMGFSIKLTAGEINAVAGVDPKTGRTDDVRLYQISAPVQSGNSGGPVFDSAGQVIGIISSKLAAFPGSESSDTPQNVNFAIKARYVDGVLADLPSIQSKVIAAADANFERIVERVRGSVMMVVTR